MLFFNVMRIKFSYKIILLQTFLSLFFNYKIFSQEIEWHKLSFGPNVSYLIFTEDLGNNWENAPAIGGSINYKIPNNFSVLGEVLISKFSPKNDVLPEIFYLGLIGGIKYSTDFTKNVSILFSGGIQSNSFEFEEEGESKLEDNSSESEFGLFIGTGIESNLINEIPFEVNFRFQSILSKPNTIKIFSISLSVFIL